MIAGLTNAVRGAALVTGRPDRAAPQATGSTAAATPEGQGGGSDAGASAAAGVALPDAVARVAAPRLALLASLRAAAATNTMVAEASALGGYATPAARR
jgi:hypothetical protein